MTDEPLLLSLEPQENEECGLKDESLLKLGYIIPRITQERGSFTNINEQLIRQEIGEEERQERESQQLEGNNELLDQEMLDAGNNNNNKEEDKTDVDRKDFDQIRAELINLVSTAQNESALSLDFVSLLLSCLRPAAGTTSMSPYLKQHVPVGSLNADSLWISIPEEDQLVGAGWKLQSLSKASDLLSKAANRLHTEVVKEEKYWNSIFDIVLNGEVLFKIKKGDTRGLAVKYGFGDAGSEYRDKGIAIMKRGSGGDMSFKFDMDKRRHVVRVNLYSTSSSGEQIKVGSSSYKNILIADDCVQSEIKNARTLIFEEELFFEIVREARLLMSHRVSIEDGKVRVAIQDEIIEIEHIDPSVEEDDEEQETCEQSNVRADLITDAFHILLCYAHRRNLAKRQSIPQPISSKSKPVSTPLFILRPILVHLQHENIIQRTTRLLEMILQNHKGSTLNSNVEEEPDQDSASHTSYLGKLMFPPTSRYELETENGILVTIVTSSPLMVYLPLYDVTATLIGDKSTVISKAGFYEISELEDWINWILKRKVD